MILLVASTAYAKDPPPPSTAKVPQYSHPAHQKIAGFSFQCMSCHKLDAKSGEPIPPGADGHQPCADVRCHGPRLNQNASGELCLECHEKGEKHQATPPRLIHREDTKREFGWRRMNEKTSAA